MITYFALFYIFLLLLVLMSGISAEKLHQVTISFIFIIIGLLIFVCVFATFAISPDESKVEFNDKYILVKYPYLKRNLKINYEDFQCIKSNYLDTNNESTIHYIGKKQSGNFVEINCIKPKEWKQLAISYKLPLILSYNLEIKIKRVWNLFYPKFVEDDWYLMKRDMKNDEMKFDKNLWSDYVFKNKAIEYLGIDELINIPERIQKEPYLHYSFKTPYGLKQIDFYDGKLLIAYEMKKEPFEIEQIGKEIGCQFVKV